MTKVAVVRASTRREGVEKSISLLGSNPVKGKKVLIKPNFNTADPAPGSTDNETLRALIGTLRRMGAGWITIGERSGPPRTADVMRQKGIPGLAEELGVELVNFEELPADQWVRVEAEHWPNGFLVPKLVTEAECVVLTPCLKTHAYGGVFTMSLKLAVGICHKDLMSGMHRSPHMRKMIAELNLAYRPELIVMDAMEAFVDGGPDRGKRARPGLFIAGSDRVAVDAVGLAVLKLIGTKEEIMQRPVFEQEQITHAAAIGIGIGSPDEIDLVSDDDELVWSLRERLTTACR